MVFESYYCYEFNWCVSATPTLIISFMQCRTINGCGLELLFNKTIYNAGLKSEHKSVPRLEIE